MTGVNALEKAKLADRDTSADRLILETLLDQYESSRRFSGQHKVERKVQVSVSRLFPQYLDHADYDTFTAVNEAIITLERQDLIIVKRDRARICQSIQLNLDTLALAYRYLDRTPKKDIQSALAELLTRYQGQNDVLDRFCLSQLERIAVNKSVAYFSNDLAEFEQILIAVAALHQVRTEMFTRDFSVRIFKDSKAFDRISSKVVNLLLEYGDFPEKDQVLTSLNLVKNPTYVHFKGAGVLVLRGQRIDLSVLSGDIALSAAVLPDIESIIATGGEVMTVENLTSFHLVTGAGRLLIYLGGFHNQVRRDFIVKVQAQNPQATYYHFGDIDAGGFQILQHLRRQTGIDFRPWKMDLPTLQKYAAYAQPLTDNDRKRLEALLETEFHAEIRYMLEHNIKLEQEAVAPGHSCGKFPDH